jgi:hypothetical protein
MMNRALFSLGNSALWSFGVRQHCAKDKWWMDHQFD